jgi:hypothetical protein
MKTSKVGRWAFVLGIIIAVLLGFVNFSFSTLVLFILGLIVGFMNISQKESQSYLVAVIALLIVGFAGLEVFNVLGGGLVTWLETVLTSFITFVAASALVVALKVVLEIEQE